MSQLTKEMVEAATEQMRREIATDPEFVRTLARNANLPMRGEFNAEIQARKDADTNEATLREQGDQQSAAASANALSTASTHAARTDNPHAVTKSQVGLSNVDNTSDANKPVSSATQAALNSKADLVNGKVPAAQLPATTFPVTKVNGATGDVVVDDSNLSAQNPANSGAVATLRTVLSSLWTAIGGKAPTVHSHQVGDVTGLQTALDGKAPVSHSHTIAQVTGLQSALDGKQPAFTTITDAQHGQRGGGDQHAKASATADGFQSKESFSRLATGKLSLSKRVSTDANGQYVWTFPAGFFSGVPVVNATVEAPAGQTAPYNAHIVGAPTNTGVTVQAYKANNGISLLGLSLLNIFSNPGAVTVNITATEP